ncbi:MAG: N-acetylneuraminate synthase family protein [Phycisphaerales bacterium]|nr:MAG: N-acetylneuraminate synthase family protein [Phycisphaerales bacterium]
MRPVSRQQTGFAPAPAERPSPVTIGATSVGPGRRVYVVAEAGVNHNGDLNTAVQLVDAALGTGADAVKFQAFRAADLVTADAATVDYQRNATGDLCQREMLRQLELGRDDFSVLCEHCRASGIELLATPFGITDLHLLTGLGVRAIKIASTDLNNHPLLEEVARANLPVILSTGASLAHELERTVNRLTELGCRERLILLHCVSAYPTAWEDANLHRIAALRERFGRPTGFSDHTCSVETGALAVAAGACLLEKHFTLDDTLPGPDHALSLAPDAMAEYITRVRRAEEALGDGELSMHASEEPVRDGCRKSIVVTRDVRPGDVLDRDILTAKRPSGGISPDEMAQLIGRRAVVPIPADTRVAWDMVD